MLDASSGKLHSLDDGKTRAFLWGAPNRSLLDERDPHYLHPAKAAIARRLRRETRMTCRRFFE